MRLAEVEVGRVERLVAMRAFPGWSELTASELAALAGAATPRWIPAGVRLFEEGAPVTTLYVVIRGELAVYRGGVELGRYGPHTGVGGLAAFARDPRGYECRALADTLALELDLEDLEEIFEDRFGVLVQVLAELARESIRVRRRLAPHAGFPARASGGEQCPARPLDLVERIFFLRRNFAFAPGRIDSVAALAKCATEVRVEKGAPLWRFGDPADALLAVVCGTVGARAPDGLSFAFGAGDLVGGLDALGEVPRWFDASAGDGLVALRVERDVALDVWEDHPDLGLDVLESVASGLLSLVERSREV